MEGQYNLPYNECGPALNPPSGGGVCVPEPSVHVTLSQPPPRSNRLPTTADVAPARAASGGAHHVLVNHKGGPVKVCLKRPDGSMVEQKHLTVTHKDGKYVINNTGEQNNQWLSQGAPIRAILIDNKQNNVQQYAPPGSRLLTPVQQSPLPHTPVHNTTQRTTPTTHRIQGTPTTHRVQGTPTTHRVQGTPTTHRVQGTPTTHRITSNQQGTPTSTNTRRVVRTPQQHTKHHIPGTGKMTLKQQTPEYTPKQEYIPQVPDFSTVQRFSNDSPTSPTTTYSPVHKQPIQYKDSDLKSLSPQGAKQYYRAPQSISLPTATNTPPNVVAAPPANQWNNNSVLNGITSIGAPANRKRYQEIPMDCADCGTPHYATTTCPARRQAATGGNCSTEARKRPRRSSERGGKGLRHFSSKVCEKVKSKGVTTYLEVSEELVAEFSNNFTTNTPSCSSFDVKNIRRRVYDALNVLCAMNIISKDKKEIRWIGLPTNSLQECRALEIQKQETQQRIKEKKKRAQEYMLQLIAYRTLVQRNKEIEHKRGASLPENSTIQVPFIILSTGPRTEIGLEVSNDKTKYEFTFNELFEIHDEIAILKKMGLCYGLDTGEFTDDGLAEAESLLPKSAKPFLKELFPRKIEGTEDNLEIVEDPQQIDIKHEPQELTEVQKQALETYSFDAPTYSSAYSSYNRAGEYTGSSTRETAAANTLLSLTTVNQ